jgi:superfamily II DNA or RNA helicase
MLKEVDWSIDRSYSSGDDNEPLQFYLDSLNSSKSFDLLLGYFSSAAISVLSLGFATFLSSGGTMRIIVNNILSEEDKEAIKKGEEGDVKNNLIDLSDIRKLKSSLDEYGIHFFECLSWLISNNKIQIKIIKPKNGRGIAHYKSGIFSDGQDSIGFSGSCNFTAFGLLENLESIDCFLSWENGRSNKMINSLRKRIDTIFSGESDQVEYLDVDSVVTAVKQEFGNKDLNELVIHEKELIQKKANLLSNLNAKSIIDKAIQKIDFIAREPKFPYPEGARQYQLDAYKNWLANGRQGIFAMATGTGKTITSLNCLLNDYKVFKSYKAIILVPTTALLEQWKKECIKFNFKNIITVSSKENWNDNLAFFNTANKFFETSFIVIVTYASLTRAKFQSHFKLLPEDTLLIADEAHNIGAPNISKLLNSIHLNKRIGLSATINRKYDDEGNLAIENFFNDRPPYIYSYTMRQALDIGWLCKYTYYPHIVYLDDSELIEYIKISKQLLMYLNPLTNTYMDNPIVEMLLLARKRIIHKARNKKGVFKSILASEFWQRENLKYSLIYVPEGTDPDYSAIDEYEEDAEDNSLINEYTKLVSETDDSIMVKQYTSKSKDRNEVIKDFEAGKVHVLTSMKCLDEGVDVPRSELAIFCASTGNPRQFIQRRGRVLRLHKDKTHAVIHDLVVVPRINPEDDNFAMEKNLIKKELERVVDFSELSMNKMDTYEELEELLDYYNLNLNDFITD